MKLYRFMPDNEWQVLVVAHNTREAKRLGYRGALMCLDKDDIDYTACRVRLVRDTRVPSPSPEIVEPTVLWTCADAPWTCWAWAAEGCDGCPQYAERMEVLEADSCG